MIQIKSLCYIFVALVGVTTAISTSSKTKISTDGPSQVLPSPSPSPSADYSSRLGNSGKSGNKKEKDDLFKPSVAFPNFAQRNHNSSESASESKSQQLSYPEQGGEEEKSQEKTDGPQSVVLQLLDEKENSNEVPPSGITDKEIPDSERSYKGEGRSKFPRIYYGEVSPPTFQVHSDAPVEDLHKKNHNSQQIQEDQPKYYYPKSQGGKHKSKSNKKKRFEYKHDEQRHQTSENHELQQSPIDSDYQKPEFHQDEVYGYNQQHHQGHGEQDSEHGTYHYGRGHHDSEHGQNHHVHEYGHHDSHHGGYHEEDHNNSPSHGHGGVDIIGKALKVLIPSALLLTGVSALFPNKIHVPTNDYSINNQNYHNIRNKRSIEYYNGMNYDRSSHILEPEHRSMGENPHDYDFEIARYADYTPIPAQEYSPELQDQNINFSNNGYEHLPRFDQPIMDDKRVEMYGQKTQLSDQSYERPIISRPSTPQEYDQFHYGPQRSFNYIVPDSTDEPNTPVPSPIVPVTPVLENLTSTEVPVEDPQPPTEKTRKRRVRIQNKKRSRPLPTPTEAPTLHIQDFQPIPETETFPVIQEISQKAASNSKLAELLTTMSTERPGDAYLRSMVQKDRISNENMEQGKQVDLSPEGPVMGLLTSYAQHDKDSPQCQKRALCELALKGQGPTATKFETFLWSLATLVPDQFSKIYELEDIFKSIRTGDCQVFACLTPNLDLQ